MPHSLGELTSPPSMPASALLRRALLLALALLLTDCARMAPTTTVILVRHAERPPGQDPELNELGRARAESLRVALTRAQVDAILHTQFKRTQQTAQPLAVSKGITPIEVRASGTEAQHAADVIARLNAFAGKTVVYVGHSNTVPAVIRALGIDPPPPIADSEHAHFFIVTRVGKGTPQLVRVKY